MKKGKLKIEILLKKSFFQSYIFGNEKKAEKSKIRKKWMIFNFNLYLKIEKHKNSDFVFQFEIKNRLARRYTNRMA